MIIAMLLSIIFLVPIGMIQAVSNTQYVVPQRIHS
jgi:ABC-type antimicrobial peptide transport system permease subunit